MLFRSFNDYPFPGNVRELRNIAIRLTAKFGGRQIERHELESELDIDNQVPDTQPTASVVAVTGEPKRQRTPEDWINVARAELENSSSFNLDDRLRQRESAYIEAAQRISGGNLSKAARLLGINRTTLYNRIDTLARIAGRKNQFDEKPPQLPE